MKKRIHKSSRIKNYKFTKNIFFFDSVPLKGYVAFLVRFIPPQTKFRGVYWSHPVQPCVRKSCPGHNFKSIEASNFKLPTQIGHIVEKCSVQEP